MVRHYLSLRYLSLAPTMMMSNHSYLRIFENEGHSVVFEQKYDGDVRNTYFRVEETKDGKGKQTSLMTMEGGYLYMDKLIEQGYVGYN